MTDRPGLEDAATSEAASAMAQNTESKDHWVGQRAQVGLAPLVSGWFCGRCSAPA